MTAICILLSLTCLYLYVSRSLPCARHRSRLWGSSSRASWCGWAETWSQFGLWWWQAWALSIPSMQSLVSINTSNGFVLFTPLCCFIDFLPHSSLLSSPPPRSSHRLFSSHLDYSPVSLLCMLPILLRGTVSPHCPWMHTLNKQTSTVRRRLHRLDRAQADLCWLAVCGPRRCALQMQVHGLAAHDSRGLDGPSRRQNQCGDGRRAAVSENSSVACWKASISSPCLLLVICQA